jgi:hypothetical protein
MIKITHRKEKNETRLARIGQVERGIDLFVDGVLAAKIVPFIRNRETKSWFWYSLISGFTFNSLTDGNLATLPTAKEWIPIVKERIRRFYDGKESKSSS